MKSSWGGDLEIGRPFLISYNWNFYSTSTAMAAYDIVGITKRAWREVISGFPAGQRWVTVLTRV
jgi:hypothetical protein